MTLDPSLTRGAADGTRTQEYIHARVRVDANGCWIWQLACDCFGYARAPHGVNAHRLSFALFNGPIPDGLTIDHLCGVRACVNPTHLEAVSQAENLRRSTTTVQAIRRTWTHCKHGHLFDAENTYWRPDGFRGCRACGRERTARYVARKAGQV